MSNAEHNQKTKSFFSRICSGNILIIYCWELVHKIYLYAVYKLLYFKVEKVNVALSVYKLTRELERVC